MLVLYPLDYHRIPLRSADDSEENLADWRRLHRRHLRVVSLNWARHLEGTAYLQRPALHGEARSDSSYHLRNNQSDKQILPEHANQALATVCSSRADSAAYGENINARGVPARRLGRGLPISVHGRTVSHGHRAIARPSYVYCRLLVSIPLQLHPHYPARARSVVLG